MFSLAKTGSRQREILEIVLGNGWDYMRGVLTRSKTDEPSLPSPEVLRKILIELGPFYVKFGQLLSTRPDLLPPRYTQALTALQANVPPVSWTQVEAVIQTQLSQPVTEIFTTIEPVPVAAGSIAQTHRAVLRNGQAIALKVQRPGIDAIVTKDITLSKAIAELIALTEVGQDYDVIALAEEFTKAVEAELDFTQEAHFTEQLQQNLSVSQWFDAEQIVVPRVYWEITTKKLLGLEWLDGKPLLEANIPASANGKADRRQVTSLLFRAFVQQIYVDGFFHADPHPGNIFYLQDGRVALLDCGMIGRLDPRTQQLLTEMLLAIVDNDAQRCAQLTLSLAESSRTPNLERLENDYARMLRKYYNVSLDQINFSQVIYELLKVARNNKIRLPSNMGLYAKSLANLEGVARQVNPEINLLDEIKPLLPDLFRRQLLGDAPLQTFLRTALDLKSLSLQSPRQLDVLLDRLSSETLKWNVQIEGLEPLRRTVGYSANRLSSSVLVGALIIGAAIISTAAPTPQLSLISNSLFAAASLLGLWLIASILRSGRSK
ncbi:MAG: ABC1 kinase family protein [Cyanophyceae cyanobacterium]